MDHPTVARVADVDDTRTFIYWGHEPPRHMGDHRNGYIARSLPQHHWCLLGQIVGKTAAPNNTHTLEIRDRDGRVRSTPLLAYKRKPNARSFKVGHTVALLYPERMDSHTGMSDHDRHYAESPQIEIFPFTLAEIIEASRKARIHATREGLPNVCQVCKDPQRYPQRCNWCKMIWYCRKGPCRAIDRRENHHQEDCKILRKMRNFLLRDWDHFHGFWLGPEDADNATESDGETSEQKNSQASKQKNSQGDDKGDEVPHASSSDAKTEAASEASSSLMAELEESFLPPDIV